MCAPASAILPETRGRNKLETPLKPPCGTLPRLMLYAAKCYWPGVNRTVIEQVAARAAEAHFERERRDVAYRGSLLFSDDDLVLCLFEGPSRAAVKRASEQLRIPCERVMASVWLDSILTNQREGANE
jgi:hypothetical protein